MAVAPHRSERAEQMLRQVIDLRRAQRMAEAAGALDKAGRLAPADPQIAFLHAQLAYERGLPATQMFARVQELWPHNAEVLRTRA